MERLATALLMITGA